MADAKARSAVFLDTIIIARRSQWERPLYSGEVYDKFHGTQAKRNHTTPGYRNTATFWQKDAVLMCDVSGQRIQLFPVVSAHTCKVCDKSVVISQLYKDNMPCTLYDTIRYDTMQ